MLFYEVDTYDLQKIEQPKRAWKEEQVVSNFLPNLNADSCLISKLARHVTHWACRSQVTQVLERTLTSQSKPDRRMIIRHISLAGHVRTP